MKSRLYYFIIILSVSSGCRERTDGCVGAAFYYLDNQSTRSLSIEFAEPVLNDQIDTAAVIDTQQRILIGQGASFGSIPRPADTFASFALYTFSDGKKNVVYRQDPVQDVLWTKRKHNSKDPDFGCQQVDYTLTITDALLK